MREPIAWLLPALAVSLLAGIYTADQFGPAVGAARALAALALGLALLVWPSGRLTAVCACVLAFALGAHGISSRVASARADASFGSFDAAVAALVCEQQHREEFSVVELCGLAPLALGDRVAPDSVPARARLLERIGTPEGDWLSGLVVGDRVRVQLRFAPIRRARNPGARRIAREEERRGIGVRGRILDARLAVRVEPRDAAWLRRWRQARAALAQRLQRVGPGGALLAVLSLGDRAGLEPEDREAFRRLGLSHLLAVSGLHLALVAALAFALVRAALLRCGSLPARRDVRPAAVVAAVAAALGYALLAGWGVPVQRAWVFVLACLGTLVVGRRSAPGHTLAAAGLTIAVLDPAAPFALGAQLSFVATSALLASVRAVPAAEQRPGLRAACARSALSSLRISATAIAATAPVLAGHGLSATPAGLAANVVAVPVTGLLLLPVSLLAAASAAAFESESLPLEVAEWIARTCIAGVRVVAALLPPFSQGPPTPGVAIALATALAVVSLGVRSTRARVILCVIVCIGLRMVPGARVGPDPPRVVVFDVGQGDSILVEGRTGAILVDGGWARAGADQGRSVIGPGLRALGVERLDIVLASHADLDHRGGLVSVVENFEVGEIWVPRGAAADFPELLGLARRKGIPFLARGAEDAVERRGDLVIEPIWPESGGPGAPLGSRNDGSLVVRVSLAGSRVLLTGDIGFEAEMALVRSGRDLQADLLKVAHHGSRGSSSRRFLAAVGFDLALVSASCSSRRPLPSREALDRLQQAGGSVWWTGRDGALILPLRSGLPTRTWGWISDPRCRAP